MAKRGRDLAGLAALGALGYMAFRGGKKDSAGTVKGDMSPADLYADAAEASRVSGTPASDDTSDFLSRRLRGINEVGQATSMENIAPMEKPRAPRVATSRAAADTTTAASDEMMRGRGMNRAPTPAVIGPRSTGAGGPTAAEMAAYRRQQMGAGAGRGGQGGPTAAEMAAYRRQQELDAMRGRGYKTQYKKGGAVKAKKMASGGMTSASKRADGIATKGKTKCKMY